MQLRSIHAPEFPAAKRLMRPLVGRDGGSSRLASIRNGCEISATVRRDVGPKSALCT